MIQVGLHLAEMYPSTQKIKAERLLVNLVNICRRVHGEDHGVTGEALSDLQKSKARYVVTSFGGEERDFQALRYEEDGVKCVIQGPIEEPRDVEGEEKLTVSTDDVFCLKGTIYLC